MELASSRLARQLALRPTRVPTLVHGQYWRTSRASPLLQYPVLQASARAARASRTPRHQSADPARKLPRRTAGAVGRSQTPLGDIPRRPPAG